MDVLFYIVVAIGALFAITDWRSGLVIAIVLDCLRDPIRKLSDGEPTLVTYCIGIVWAAAFANLFAGKHPGLQRVRKRFP